MCFSGSCDTVRKESDIEAFEEVLDSRRNCEGIMSAQELDNGKTTAYLHCQIASPEL